MAICEQPDCFAEATLSLSWTVTAPMTTISRQVLMCGQHGRAAADALVAVKMDSVSMTAWSDSTQAPLIWADAGCWAPTITPCPYPASWHLIGEQLHYICQHHAAALA